MRLDNLQRIRLGEGLMAAGLVLLALHPAAWCVPAALFLLGLGCAPVYPAIMHQTPATFGAENSQAIMGLQMASAYVGTTLMPPLFGLLSEGIGLWLYPFYLALFVVGLTLCTQTVSRALTRRAA
jgi:fucose permease